MANQNKTTASVGIGIIGAGIHGGRYLNHAASDVPGMHVSALCRRNENAGRQMANKLGCRYHQESQELIVAPDVDAIIICTPPSTHYLLAREVLAAGKPLLLEKPLTGTLQQARMLAKDAAGACVLVGQTLRWNPVIDKVRQLWPRLGKVHHIRLAQRLAPTNLSWQHNLEETVGGSVLLTGVHLFDLVRYLSGAEFSTVNSRQQKILNPVVEDFFLAQATLDDGCWVSMEVSKYTRSRACWLEAVGEKGQIFADYLGSGVVFREGVVEEKFPVSAQIPTIPLVLENWLAAIRGLAEPRATMADGVATMQMVEACYRSARLGCAVNIQ